MRDAIYNGGIPFNQITTSTLQQISIHYFNNLENLKMKRTSIIFTILFIVFGICQAQEIVNDSVRYVPMRKYPVINERQVVTDSIRSIQSLAKKKEKQEVEKYVYSNPGTSIYFELAGKGLFAINVDYRINKFNALSVGISPAEGAVLPSIMYYKFSRMKHRFETGIGITGILGQPEGLIGIFVNGAIGYRYQKKNGLIFRIGYTPLIGISESRVAFIPLFFGVSLGYSF
jgi:hypothetical protein